MKALTFFFAIAMLVFCGCQVRDTPTAADPVNTIIGDISYKEKFGRLPSENTDEVTRIQTHLEYVEQLLRHKSVAGMPAAMQRKRAGMLDLLHEYWVTAKFPVNYDHPGKRKPCFIDRNGAICAVGYLVAKTGGRQLAELVNKEHQYDNLANMGTPALHAWMKNSGLTAEECAMIQPTYGGFYPYYERPNYVSPVNGVVTGVWSGLNTAMCIGNVMQMNRGRASNATATIGALSGLGQVVFGIATLPKEDKDINPALSNNAQKNVSFLNVGIGTATMVLSLWNRLSDKKHLSKNSVGVYSFPTPDNQTGIALCLTRKI